MAASASKDKAAKAKDAQRKDEEREAQRKQKEKAAKAKQKEREAEQKQKEKEAKRKEKEKEAKRKEKEKEAERKEKEKARKAEEKEKQREAKRKEEERAAKAKAKQREARQKEKEREEKAKAKRDAQRASNAKERERADKARAKEREAERKEREREKAAKDKARARREAAASGGRAARSAAADESGAGSGAEPVVEPVQPVQPVQPVEEVAAPERGETTEVPAEVRDEAADGTDAGGRAADGSGSALAPLPELDVPDNDKTVRPKGYLAEALGKEDAVGRSTQRATLAASYTTRDHDVIRAWASTRGGRPADVAGTGRGNGAGVLRIEFPDGPGDDSRLEDIDWSPFFATFDESDVDFLYQERVRTGDVSRFHKFVRADR